MGEKKEMKEELFCLLGGENFLGQNKSAARFFGILKYVQV